ncbi:unnamed protein product [Arabis nemorensis]|uniref:O-acyltransferase WSD1 C-terminal domain-containing protein n=1 Tax=Arabis nemorensis TaxID=586526 RepID=A0A565CQ07_9BRAS|nr:unnamed protein product [Arabis nemorensis]
MKPDMMAKDSRSRWGNHISLVLLPLSIGLETDPLVYLSKAKSTMDRKKNFLHAPMLYSIIEFIFNVLGAKVGAILFKRTVQNTTTFISNVIGPTEEISFHGHPISLWTLPSPNYADKIVISVAVDPTVIPDPHKLCDEMEESLKAMKAVVAQRGLLINSQ